MTPAQRRELLERLSKMQSVGATILSQASAAKRLVESIREAVQPRIDDAFGWQPTATWPQKSPDGVWQVADWSGTGGKLSKANVALTGGLHLTVPARVEGAEVQTLDTYGYGYYEVRMRAAPVAGVVSAFFLIQAPGYGPHEIDIEFLTNEPWIDTDTGRVHFMVHPDPKDNGTDRWVDLPFNPSRGFHDYGILWTPTELVYYVDGAEIHRYTGAANIPSTEPHFIMANTWTGNREWGGGPPAEPATTSYERVRYWPDVTERPST